MPTWATFKVGDRNEEYSGCSQGESEASRPYGVNGFAWQDAVADLVCFIQRSRFPFDYPGF
jgi:hypothetical protein